MSTYVWLAALGTRGGLDALVVLLGPLLTPPLLPMPPAALRVHSALPEMPVLVPSLGSPLVAEGQRRLCPRASVWPASAARRSQARPLPRAACRGGHSPLPSRVVGKHALAWDRLCSRALLRPWSTGQGQSECRACRRRQESEGCAHARFRAQPSCGYCHGANREQREGWTRRRCWGQASSGLARCVDARTEGWG